MNPAPPAVDDYVTRGAGKRKDKALGIEEMIAELQGGKGGESIPSGLPTPQDSVKKFFDNTPNGRQRFFAKAAKKPRTRDARRGSNNGTPGKCCLIYVPWSWMKVATDMKTPKIPTELLKELMSVAV